MLRTVVIFLRNGYFDYEVEQFLTCPKFKFFSAEDNYTRTDIFLYDKKTHAFARGRLGKSDRHLLDGAASQCVPLPLS